MLTEIHWQPADNKKLEEFLQKSSELRTHDRALFQAIKAGRESIVIPEVVKSCLFFSLGEYHKNQGDYISTYVNYFYSLFHSAVAIRKAHFEHNVVPEKEFSPEIITTNRRQTRGFIARLNEEKLISDNYRELYDALEKRRDHLNYQPRVTLSGDSGRVVTFFSCQYANLVSELQDKGARLSNAILETAELVGHALCYYHDNLEVPDKELLATLMFKNWANICILTYQYWGSSVETRMYEGLRFNWNTPFEYVIGDKTRKSLVPLKVIMTTKEKMKPVLELVREYFLHPRFCSLSGRRTH
jgi:hypothetical protein